MAPDADGAIFGAFDGGTLVGSIGVHRERRRKLSHKAVIWGVYVAPAFRGRGVGRRLLERALAHASAMADLLQLTLGVNSANAAAIALYRSMGFEPFGLERGFMRVDGVLHDELHMALRLAKLDDASTTPTRR
jgi:RimJ/RimL family protein N-acetyltransferase